MPTATRSPSSPPASRLSPDALRAEFVGASGYLAACSTGLPSLGTRAAMTADLHARPDLLHYAAVTERARASFAHLVGVGADRVAIGSQTSVLASLLAAGLPAGATVLCPEGEFSSLVLPFAHAGRGIRVRTVPLGDLAEALSSSDDLVAFSIVQSATGEVADADAIVTAARRHGARVVCDATQAVGWLPVDAARFDALVCHAYKWLCAPRGAAFLALSEDFAATLEPVQAGWYAGDDPWSACYGADARLAEDARRFDVSPAWQAMVGAEPAIAMFAQADAAALHDRVTGLAARFRDRLALPQPARATPIVTWADADGVDLARLTHAGVTASGRRGNARVAFHVFNDESDIDLAAAALGR
ncbi:aminotransferase class V-fold PLP-dependent enzyme [Microbacterium radiodurans]|uniref:Aminotransferase class V-fold PLP-dependent enzyme n=1 Tax=Microbacterium radiodurans TaxID=661398 RepID=A0A5J5IUH7_9MICO|nr:aminotransferase class V-fold PLP-dependent enzyme [Microbacterium radiodurans]KAA9086944.1 aminotransferase class V-fold PLP-dependent enzyme [Microbacterium radiodurans]